MESITALYATAASIGLVHTLLGPDHYIPFIGMARARSWSLGKTLVVTGVCGLGHVLSSVFLGLVGVVLWRVFGHDAAALLGKLTGIEESRGGFAAWLLVAFGLTYMVWGIHRAVRNRPHTHFHVHGDGTVHAHEHAHHGEHAHVHADARNPSITPWVLFAIFVFGPCEPLIPLLMFPAAEGSLWHVAGVTVVFGFITIATMTTVVALAYVGLGALRFSRWQRYSHALAGFALLACGLAVKTGL